MQDPWVGQPAREQSRQPRFVKPAPLTPAAWGNGAIAGGNGAIAGYPSAGINRHAVGNERVLQERSSEPPDLESCGGGREAVVEA